MLRFFAHPDTKKALDYLSGRSDLTVFAGAGVSKEVGLPSWRELVDGLLNRAIRQRRWQRDTGWIAGRLLGGGDLLGAAERIEQMIGPDRLRGEIGRVLYRGDPPGVIEPGPLARGVAAMRVAWGEGLRIATTNYDQLLVRALRSAGLPAARSYCTNSTLVGVVHLHGVIGFEPPADGENEIVLTERSYLAPTGGGWRADFMDAQLQKPCLFLGASLTDLNLLRSLHTQRPAPGVRHYVAFVRDPARPGEDRRRRDRLEQVERRRWRALKIEPLFADNYADVAQFAFELALRRRVPDARSLPDRFGRWFARRERDVLHQGPRRYPANQREFAAELARVLRELRELLDLDDPVMSLAVCALFSPEGDGQERPVIWATSDRAMTTVDTLDFLPLDADSDWTVVKALCSGTHGAEPKETYASRWKYVWAEPIFSPPPARLPLGGVILSTTSTEAETALPVRSRGSSANATAARVAALRQALTRVGRAVLVAEG